MQIDVIDHPVLADRLTRLRTTTTDRAAFRRLLRGIGTVLVYEATRHQETVPVVVDSPMGAAEGVALTQTPVLIPILRAGLGLLDAALDVLPDARTGFLGLKRDETTLQPDVYMNTLPDLDGAPAFVLDPMLATGGSAVHACQEVRAAGAGVVTLVCVLSAPEGIETVRTAGVADRLVTAVIDSHLNDVGFIVPGLGDAGDRQFGLD